MVFRSFTKCLGSIWLHSEMVKDRTRWDFSLGTKEREGRTLMDKEDRKRERKWETIMSQNSRKDKSSNQMKSSSRPNIAEKHAVIAVNTERCSQTLWKWI